MICLRLPDVYIETACQSASRVFRVEKGYRNLNVPNKHLPGSLVIHQKKSVYLRITELFRLEGSARAGCPELYLVEF